MSFCHNIEEEGKQLMKAVWHAIVPPNVSANISVKEDEENREEKG